MAFVLGFKGREWAWKNAKWNSLEHFNRVQRLWSIWALVLTLGVGGLGILAAVAIPAYQDYTNRAKIAEVITSLSDAKTALAERLRSKPNGGLLSADEVNSISSSVVKGRYVNGVDTYAIGNYADVVASASIGSVAGSIYVYSKDGGQSWVCGSTDLAANYLPSSCRDSGGLNRPDPPKPQEKFGLWEMSFAKEFYAGCVRSAQNSNPEMAGEFCKCATSHLSEMVTQDQIQAETANPEIETAKSQARDLCVVKASSTN